MDVAPMDFVGFGLFSLVSFALSIAVAVLLVVLILLSIRWLLRANNNTGSGAGTPGRATSADDAAIAALRERFARGEIDEEEFQQRRRVLDG
jgi:putative membrane protein